ncbi:hypothetical protein CEXT_590541 [Caerostris extrusa]|uniref:Uncharacterized protein n=1 Tax=Caerostris extrusa TaxID=172846 RepID=A0AAV4X0F6_CAEEX|nr:hypothetical protein CEXT_590541 [Caerostris extrusa]
MTQRGANRPACVLFFQARGQAPLQLRGQLMLREISMLNGEMDTVRMKSVICSRCLPKSEERERENSAVYRSGDEHFLTKSLEDETNAAKKIIEQEKSTNETSVCATFEMNWGEFVNLKSDEYRCCGRTSVRIRSVLFCKRLRMAMLDLGCCPQTGLA